MVYLLILISELILLYFLSREFTKLVYKFFLKVTKSRNLSLYLFAVLFVPGTFIHEMAHSLFALVLLVPVGQMNLIPKISDKGVRLGTVPIAKTDPIRRTIIGFAPFLMGITIMCLSVFLVFEFELLNNWWIVIGMSYLNFQIGNTMFMSRKDLEGAWGLLVSVLVLYITLYLFGFRVIADPNVIFSSSVNAVLVGASLYLIIPILIDMFGIIILEIFRRFTN